jgi:glycosyltransferase involved in cell wall biosynthesis
LARMGHTVMRPQEDGRLAIAVLLDSPDEDWRAMDLVGEMLLAQWHRESFRVDATGISLPIARVARRLPWLAKTKRGWNVDRALTRYLAYPLRAVAARRPARFFHIVDHSYAMLLRALPASRTGIYCHDIDAFRPAMPSEADTDSDPWNWKRVLARALLNSIQSAAVVFYSTRAVGQVLESSGIVPRAKLVQAPYGVAPEFTALADPRDGADDVLGCLGQRPFVLHVGTEIQRKRLDVLFQVFARLLADRPELRLVQQGANLSATQREQVEKLGIGHALLQPPRLERKKLAGLYRRAAAVLVPSDAEGFGFPVIEALACGAVVIASDIPVLREVGGSAALYAPVGDVEAWANMARAVLAERTTTPPPDDRVAQAKLFTWGRHAQTILDAYKHIPAVGPV